MQAPIKLDGNHKIYYQEIDESSSADVFKYYTCWSDAVI